MKIYFSLKNILTVNFVFVATLPVLIVGLLGLYILTANLEKEIAAKNLLLARSLASEVERFLDEPLRLLTQINDVTTLGGLLREDAINTYLATVIKNYHYFETIMILDQQGNVRYLAPYNEDLLGSDLSRQDFFRRTQERQQPYWSPTFLSVRTGQPTLTLSIPAPDGMIVGYLDLTVLNAIIAKVKIGSSGYAGIADHDGTVIAHPNRALVAQRLNVQYLPIVQQAWQGIEGTFPYRFDDTDKLGSVVLVPSTHWLVVVIQPVTEAYAAIYRIRAVFWVGLLIAIALAISVALTILAKTLRPLSQLTQYSQKAAAGNYHLAPPHKHYREVDVLAQSFSVMLAAVKAREDALRESEDRLRRVLQNMPVMMDAFDAENRVIVWNRECVRVTGYPAVEMLGNPKGLELLYPDSAYRANVLAEIAARGSEFRNREWELTCKDGSIRTIAWSNISKQFPIPGWEAWAIGVDVTDRKQAQTELTEKHALLQILIDSTPDQIYMKDVAGRFLIANQAMMHALGAVTLAELVGKTDFDLHLPERARQSYQEEQAVFASGKPLINREDSDVDRETGNHRWFLTTKVLVHDRQGNLKGLVGLNREITERKRAEEALRKLNVELEHRVHERTTELEAANRELKDFAYVVSHDLKSPLRAINRLVQWIVEDYAGAFDVKGHEMAELLIGRVKRMDNLIDGVLEYSRIGRVIGSAEPIDVNMLLRDVLDTLAPPPAIRITIPPELPVMLGDKIRITQVFQNLIGNAIKFMDKPQGEITIGCADHGDYWQFSVTDNGPGIEPKHHEKIFQIFQTLKPRDERESTGIGLSIVKKIVELYGGRVWVESTVGQGSTFYFTLSKKPGSS
jgi:two-component system sensor kinase FixL